MPITILLEFIILNKSLDDNKEGKLLTSWGEGRWLVNEAGILVLIWNGREHKMTIGKNRIINNREYGIKIV